MKEIYFHNFIVLSHISKIISLESLPTYPLGQRLFLFSNRIQNSDLFIFDRSDYIYKHCRNYVTAKIFSSVCPCAQRCFPLCSDTKIAHLNQPTGSDVFLFKNNHCILVAAENLSFFLKSSFDLPAKQTFRVRQQSTSPLSLFARTFFCQRLPS